MEYLDAVAPRRLDLDVARADESIAERAADHRVLDAIQWYGFGEAGEHAAFDDDAVVGQQICLQAPAQDVDPHPTDREYLDDQHDDGFHAVEVAARSCRG